MFEYACYADSMRRDETHSLARDIESRIRIFPKAERARIQDAAVLAAELHANQVRQDGTPYINHVLRATKDIFDLEGLRDADIVCATLLHDTVEDQLTGFTPYVADDASVRSPKEKALAHIDARFGTRVARIVEMVTRDKDPGEPQGVRDEKYSGYIETTIRDADAFCVKLADFYDNAFNFYAIRDIEKQVARARKYLPAFEVVRQRLWDTDIPIKDSRKRFIATELDRGEAKARQLIESAET